MHIIQILVLLNINKILFENTLKYFGDQQNVCLTWTMIFSIRRFIKLENYARICANYEDSYMHLHLILLAGYFSLYIFNKYFITYSYAINNLKNCITH